uniref:Kininogen 1 n=1 Tax=Macaca nemestrina TaxID=9545 RepID=A0A2K6E7Z7_MACNE
MKLIIILFLCSRLLLSLTQESQSEEIDCNDKDLFKAVDAALKKYNSQNQSNNQFVLYRITEATKMVRSDTFYSFKYEIKEGDCPVQSGKTWQDCDYKDAAEAATGECTATVGKRASMKFSVATQTCQITPAEGPVVTAQYNCLGCVHPISTQSPDLEPILRHGVQYFNNNTQHSSLFTLSEVKRAQRQDTGECTDNAYVDTQLQIASFSQKCDIYPGEDFVQPPSKICVGCPRDIPTNSPELEETLTHTITKLNAENNATFYFKIDNVKKARVQVCKLCYKSSNTIVYVLCYLEKKNLPTCNCQPLECMIQITISLMKRPPGFSPFRSTQVGEIKEETTSHLRSCEYKGRPPKAGAEPASEREVS